MKKIRYIAFGVLSLLFGVCLLSFIPKSDVSASYLEGGESDMTIVTDISCLPDYAISSVQGVSYVGYFYISYVIDTSLLNYNLCFCDCYDCGCNSYIKMKKMAFNFLFNGKKYGVRVSADSYIAYDGVYSAFFILKNTGFVTFEIFNSHIGFPSGKVFSRLGGCVSDDFDKIVNMKYDDDCFVPIYDFGLDSNPFKSFYDDLFEGQGDICYISNFEIYNCYFYINDSYVNCLDYFSSLGSFRFHVFVNKANSYVGNCEIGCYIEEISIDVYRPSYRLNNSLIVYVYDYYPFLSFVDQFNCYLRRGDSLYKMMYSDDGGVPNSKMLICYCEEYNNMVFDEYISLDFYLFGVYGDCLKIIDDVFCIDFGFDFNFVQYAQPLVASNGSYNYSFKKPSYVDMSFSLYPFYIPVLEMCQNAIIFLVFYCPIISDILELIYLDRFIGALLQIINFILGVPIGSFVLACIGFIVYYMVLRSFMPIIYDSVGGLYRGSNGYRYSQEKKNSKKEWQYQKYKDKKINKKVSKISNKKNQ